jgi:hypothetical protein
VPNLSHKELVAIWILLGALVMGFVSLPMLHASELPEAPQPQAKPEAAWAVERVIESPRTYRASQGVLIGGALFDAIETAHGVPVHGEGGWTAHVFGAHSTAGAVGGNLAVSVGVLFLSHELATHGGRKGRAFASMLNTARGAQQIGAASTWVGPQWWDQAKYRK